jgi:hypothetical protein
MFSLATASRCSVVAVGGQSNPLLTQRAQGLRRVIEGLSGLSAQKAAEELNAMNVPTPNGGKWHVTTVIRVRERLGL